MRKKIFAVVVALISIVGFSTPASAQLKFGPKVGLNVNKITFNKDILNTENRMGFTAGLMAELTAPKIGVGVDASLMYVRRSAAWMEATGEETAANDYIAIPLNLKWKIGSLLPGIRSVINPYVLTGPEFAFLCSNKTINDMVHLNNFDVSWNLGAGVELFNHVQVTVSYGIGMTKAFDKFFKYTGEHAGIGANKCWTITAAYLF